MSIEPRTQVRVIPQRRRRKVIHWRGAIQRHSIWFLPLGFGLLAFLTRSRHPTFDAWLYSQQVEGAIRLGTGLAEPELWHPHHLAYSPLGYILVRTSRWLIGPLPALMVLQALSAACAAGCLWALARILGATRVGRRESAAPTSGDVLALLPLAFSFAFWYFAGEAEVYLPALCFACMGLAILVCSRPSNALRIPATACLLLASTLMHQMMVFLALPLVLWSLSSRVSSPRSALVILLLWGLGALLIYFLVWRLVVQPSEAKGFDFGTWITYYMHTSARVRLGWGHVDMGTPVRALMGLARSIFGGHMVLALNPEIVKILRGLAPGSFILHELRVMEATPRVVAWFAFLCMLASGAIWVGGLFGAIRSQPPRAPEPDAMRIGLLFGLWSLSTVLFILWWQADNPEFWLLALPGMAMWLAIATRGRWSRFMFSLGLFTLVGAVLFGAIVPKAFGPHAGELSMFARVGGLPVERGGGRIWPGFVEVFLPDATLRPLWVRVPADGALDSLEHDCKERRTRVWVLPDSVAAPHLAGRAVRIDCAGSWSVWSLSAGKPGT